MFACPPWLVFLSFFENPIFQVCWANFSHVAIVFFISFLFSFFKSWFTILSHSPKIVVYYRYLFWCTQSNFGSAWESTKMQGIKIPPIVYKFALYRPSTPAFHSVVDRSIVGRWSVDEWSSVRCGFYSLSNLLVQLSIVSVLCVSLVVIKLNFFFIINSVPLILFMSII